MEQLTLALDSLSMKDRQLYKPHLSRRVHSLSRPLYDLETVDLKMKKSKKKSGQLKQPQRNAAMDVMAPLSPPPPPVVDYNQSLRS